MRRMLLLVTEALIMTAMLVAMAMPAFADAKAPNASCIAVGTTAVAPESFGETVGEDFSGPAQNGGLGRFFSKENRGSLYSSFSPNC